MTPGRYHLELVSAADELAFTVPLDAQGSLNTDEDLAFTARWANANYSGTLVLEGPPHHALHWDPDEVDWEPYLTDLFTVPIRPQSIITVWLGNLPSCPRRQFRVNCLALVKEP